MGRKATKNGTIKSFYLSNEAIANLEKMKEYFDTSATEVVERAITNLSKAMSNVILNNTKQVKRV